MAAAAGSQVQRLQELLVAKREHDEAVARIEECVAQGLLSAGEAAEQRSMAARALMGGKGRFGRISRRRLPASRRPTRR